MRNFQGINFYMNLNIYGDFQVCITVPLNSKCNDHASIRKIKVCYPEIIPGTFQFTLRSTEDVNKETIY